MSLLAFILLAVGRRGWSKQSTATTTFSQPASSTAGRSSFSGDGSTFVYGRSASSGPGRVYVVALNGAVAEKTAELTPQITESSFGLYSTAVSADGSTVAVAAPLRSSPVVQCGAVEVFRKSAGLWARVQVVSGSNSYEQLGFNGVHLSSNGAVMAVSPGAGFPGVYIYSAAGGSFAFSQLVPASPGRFWASTDLDYLAVPAASGGTTVYKKVGASWSSYFSLVGEKPLGLSGGGEWLVAQSGAAPFDVRFYKNSGAGFTLDSTLTGVGQDLQVPSSEVATTQRHDFSATGEYFAVYISGQSPVVYCKNGGAWEVDVAAVPGLFSQLPDGKPRLSPMANYLVWPGETSFVHAYR